MKKLLSVVVAAIMLLSCAVIVSAATVTTTITYEAPYAGVYEASVTGATGTITFTNETGHTATFNAGSSATKYFYLFKGNNTITVTAESGVSYTGITFTEMEDQGEAYIDQVDVAYTPYGTQHIFVNFWEPTQASGAYEYGTHPDFVDSIGNPQGKFLAFSPHAQLTFAVNVPAGGAGIVYPYFRFGDSNGENSFLVSSDAGFYAEITKDLWNWQWTCFADGSSGNDMEFLYLHEGTNYITIKHTGKRPAYLIDVRLSMTDGSDGIREGTRWSSQIAMSSLKIKTPEPPIDYGFYPIGWNGVVSTHPDYDATATPLMIDALWPNMSGPDGEEVYGTDWGYTGSAAGLPQDAPPYTAEGMSLANNAWVKYTVNASTAGMYLAESDGLGLHIESATGNYADFATDPDELAAEYIYLEAGNNVFTVTGGADTEFTYVYFYPLNNSNKYLEQRKIHVVHTEPYDIIVGAYSDRVNDDGFYQLAPYNAVVQYAGCSMRYDVDVQFPGIYRVQAKIGGNRSEPYPTITIDTDGDNGYRALLWSGYADDWGVMRATGPDGNYQYVYLKEGVNHVQVKAGGTHDVLWTVEFKLLTAAEQSTITMDDLVKTPPLPITINPYTDSIVDRRDVDYHVIDGRLAGNVPLTGSAFGTELVGGEWQRFEINVNTPGIYQIYATAAIYRVDTVLRVETETSVGSVNIPWNSTSGTNDGNYKNVAGGYVELKQGLNNIYIFNEGPGYGFFKSITFDYVADASGIQPRIFVDATKYNGATEFESGKVNGYSVRNNYRGIYMGSASDGVQTTDTKTYDITIPANDYYGLLLTATMALQGQLNVTLTKDGVAPITLCEGLTPYFGNENTVSTCTMTSEKVYIPAGDYTMTVTFIENKDVGTDAMCLAHFHGFELTTLTVQDELLAAMQGASTTDEIADILAEYADVLKTDIGANVATDFIYPEYAYAALLNAAMLPTGSYETYEDVKTAYDFAKNIIASRASDSGTGITYTIQVGDWNDVGTTAVVAVYDEYGVLYTVGDGVLDYDVQTYTYQPVEVTLEDYEPYPTDVIKIFVWDSYGSLKPVF